MYIYFLRPALLLFLLSVPLFLIVYFFSFFYKKKAISFPNFEVMEKISGFGIMSKNFMSLYFNLILVCLIVFSLAGTVIVFNAQSSVSAYVLAIDSSGSMRTQDLVPNRLEAAKTSANAFVDSVPVGTEIGIISFAGTSQIVQNLGSSKLETKLAIDSIDFSESEGTNLYSAVLNSKTILEAQNSRAVVLISDGQVNIGDVSDAIKYANSNNIVVNTIAIGTVEGGKTEFNTVSKVDEDSLRALAYNTGGKFFSAQGNSQLSQSFSSILEKSYRQVSLDISAYLAILALVVLFVNWILFNFRFRTLP